MSDYSYEDLILNSQNNAEDDCNGCPYTSDCHGQCEEVEVIYNPNLKR